VAELLAKVRATLEQTTALPRADVFRFEHVFYRPWCGMERSLLALVALAFRSLALAGTASFVAAVTTAVQHGSTDSHALRCFVLALMTK